MHHITDKSEKTEIKPLCGKKTRKKTCHSDSSCGCDARGIAYNITENKAHLQ